MLKEVVEGEVRLLVPDVEKPEEGAVFFNPVQKLSRDFSICVNSAEGTETLCDLLAATGARGIRIAKEIGATVTCNDYSREACELTGKNAELNDLKGKVEVTNHEGNSLLCRGTWDSVDIDPFGTPVDFIELGCKAAKKLLAITATDPAALCGVYPRVTRRRYLADVSKTEFYHEIGIRILAGYAIRMAGKFDIALSPVVCHSSNHYYRIYFRKEKGAGRADKILEQVGYLNWCPVCLERGIEKKCAHDGARLIGPLYIGRLFDSELCGRALLEARTREFVQAEKLLSTICAEADLPPFHYDHHWLCKMKRVQPGKFGKLLGDLQTAGWKTSRTHFSDTGLRTDTPLAEIMKFV